MILTFVVVFTYFVSTNTPRKLFGNSAAMIGAAYSACNFVSVSFTFILASGIHVTLLQVENSVHETFAVQHLEQHNGTTR